MICTLTIVRYPKWCGWAGILSMAVFRIVLWFSPQFSFYKLMGSGRNGTFDKRPDWRQWAVLLAGDSTPYPPRLFAKWWRFFRCEVFTIELKPIEGHGSWDGKACFGALPRDSGYEGQIATLTRATIRVSKLGTFWRHVEQAANGMASAQGFVTSFGIGELPWIKQATFSVWESKADMKAFAYRSHAHADVIRKTRAQAWYSEEMFVRFMITGSQGMLHGKNPLERKQ